MRKLTLIMLTCLFGIISMQAQNRKVTVSGTVLDEDGKTPIMQATVQILNAEGKYINGAASLQNGHFQLPAVVAGKYTLKVSFVGYTSKSIPLTLSSGKTNYNIGKIIMKSDAIMMKEAVVTAAAAQVQVKEDTFVYNSSAYRVPEGSALEELVKKLPGAQVDDSGNITINGKEIKRIMVDGKEFFSTDTKVAMKNLPVEMIDKIKAYDKKSDLAKVTGIDDGEEETVLDLTVKKGMKQGWFGNTDIGAGSKDRYSGKLMVNRFSDNQQVSAIGSANNTNDNGFPGGGGGFRMGNQNGLNASKMGGINFAIDSPKLELGGNVRYSHKDGDVLSKASSDNFRSTGNSYSNSLSKSLSMSENVNADFRIEWKPDSLTDILMRPSASYSRSNSYSGNQSLMFNNDPYLYVTDPLNMYKEIPDSVMVNGSDSRSQSNSKTYSANMELQINRKLNSKGRNITLRTTGGYSKSNSKSSSIAQTEYYQIQNVAGTDSINYRNRYIVTPTRNWNYSVQLTYSEPILRAMFLQFSYKFSYSYQKSDKSTYSFLEDMGLDLFDIPNDYQNYFDTDLSKFAENRYYNQDYSLTLRVVRPKYLMNVGVSLQPQKSTTSYEQGAYKIDTTRNVTNITPMFDFRYRFSKISQLRIMYRGSSTQPSITDLLPITDDSDPLNVRVGNPGLKPSFSNTFRLFYNDYNAEKQRGIMTHFSFSNTLNSITSTQYTNELTGGRTIKPENINGNWNAFGIVNLNMAVTKDKKLTLNSFTNGSYTNAVAYLAQDDTNKQKNTTRTSGVSERLTTTYRTNWVEFSLNGSLDYSHSRNLLQEANNMDTYQFSYGASTNVTLPWNMTLSTDLTNSSRRGYSEASMNTNELIWNAQFSQNFLKGNAATLSLQFYDILHQQSTLSRSISASARSDTQYNSISSYCMLHFIYRLNIFGSKEAREKMRSRGGRFGGPGFGGPGGHQGGGRPPMF